MGTRRGVLRARSTREKISATRSARCACGTLESQASVDASSQALMSMRWS